MPLTSIAVCSVPIAPLCGSRPASWAAGAGREAAAPASHAHLYVSHRQRMNALPLPAANGCPASAPPCPSAAVQAAGVPVPGGRLHHAGRELPAPAHEPAQEHRAGERGDRRAVRGGAWVGGRVHVGALLAGFWNFSSAESCCPMPWPNVSTRADVLAFNPVVHKV